MLDTVYSTRILTYAGNIPRLGHLDHADGTASAHSRLCGSTVTVEVRLEGDMIADFAHQVRACALGQASSAIMARHVVGAGIDEVRAVRDAMRRMLKEDGPPPEGRFAELAVLEPVRDYKARHASTLLTFDATVEAIDKALAARAAPPA